jgi:ParB family transcriptional regulator, chromosome partitioning protein
MAAGTGKRVSLSSLVSDKITEGGVPEFVSETTPRSWKVDLVAPNPLNTREVYRHPEKIASIAQSIREHGQLQPCAVVTKSSFLALFPEHEAAVQGANFVQVTGGRRRAAIIQAGLPTIDIVVKQDLAKSRSGFISATAAENIDREDLDPVEEARVVELLVKEAGSGRAAAEQLQRTAAWVTQRLNLLKLAPGVQEALCLSNREDRVPLREVRHLHTMHSEDQLAWLAEWRARQAAGPAAVGVGDGGGVPQSPAPSTSAAGKVPGQRSPFASAIRRLGGTPVKIADALRTELSHEDVKALAEELLRDI